jgi:hypothetical protein
VFDVHDIYLRACSFVVSIAVAVFGGESERRFGAEASVVVMVVFLQTVLVPVSLVLRRFVTYTAAEMNCCCDSDSLASWRQWLLLFTFKLTVETVAARSESTPPRR